MSFYISGGVGAFFGQHRRGLRPDLRPLLRPDLRPRLPLQIANEAYVAHLSWAHAANHVPPLLAVPRPPQAQAPEVFVDGPVVIPELSDAVAAKRARKDVDERTFVLSQLTDLLSKYYMHTSMLEKIFAEEGVLDPMSESILALFYIKKTATLQKRASSLRIYARWFETSGYLTEQFAEEAVVFKYTCFLHNENAPATRASSLREALNFVGGTLSLDQTEMQQSRRIKGMCCRLRRGAHAVRQRDPLTKSMVNDLEKLLVSEADAGTIDAVLAATALFGLYARVRVGDLRRCSIEPTLSMASDRSTGTLETQFFDHKTARPGTRRALPVAAPVFGVSGACWGESFVRARRTAHLDASDGACLVPARGRGYWLGVPYSTAEFAMALRDLLRRLGYSAEAIANIGSHSLKATLLSWAGRYGMIRDHRRLLGYHSQAGDRSTDTYVRDLLAAPLRSLDEMLEKVRLGSFVPDGGRAGAFPKEVVGDDAEDELSLSSCSSESQQVSDDEPKEPDEPDGEIGQIVLNMRSRICHVSGSDGMRCGKAWPKDYQVLEAPPADSRLCCRCF